MRKIAIIAIATLLGLPVAAQAELVVNISKAQQQLSVVVDGETAYRWPVSTGRPRYPTPAGKFRPIRLEKDWYSRKYNMTPMPFSVFFYKGYAVHGTLEAKRLGRAVSHGCVRLLPANASILFALVREHGFRRTQFVVMNGPLPKGPVPKPPAPKPPGDAPVGMAELAQPHPHLVLASHRQEETRQQEEVSSRAVAEETLANDVPKARARVASLDYSVSVGSEAQVLRERAAWLRAIDRKYGIAR